MTNICENTIEITGNKNNLKKIENLLNINGKKIRVKFFNKLCGDVCHVDQNKVKRFKDSLKKEHIDAINYMKKSLGHRKPFDLDKLLNSKSLQELLRFGAKDINFNEVEYEINDDGIKIKFKTSYYSPKAFIKQLSSKYDVVVNITFNNDYILGDENYIIDRNNS